MTGCRLVLSVLFLFLWSPSRHKWRQVSFHTLYFISYHSVLLITAVFNYASPEECTRHNPAVNLITFSFHRWYHEYSFIRARLRNRPGQYISYCRLPADIMVLLCINHCHPLNDQKLNYRNAKDIYFFETMSPSDGLSTRGDSCPAWVCFCGKLKAKVKPYNATSSQFSECLEIM